jgi:hypothetical protein
MNSEVIMLRILASIVPLFFIGCFPYVYHDQNRVLIENVDLDSSLEIARIELDEGGFDATLAVWAIRDQVVSTCHAMAVSELYFEYIDEIAAETDRTVADFGVWHFAWAVSNLYRNGNDSIKTVLDDAYRDARRRPETLEKFKDAASEHVNGTKIYMGDIHAFARSYARSHIVAPGNKKYLQSLDQYMKNRSGN